MPAGLAEKIYYQSPIWLQNMVFSLYGWKLRRQRLGPHFFERLEQLKTTEWWRAEQIEEYQNHNISNIVSYAYKNVPFYRRWYDDLGVDVKEIRSKADLHKLPILTKELVKANHHDMVSQAFDKRFLHRALTSGTTGTPLTIFLSKEGLAFQWAVWWRHKSRFQLSPNDRHLTFGARVPIAQNQKAPPYWRNDFFGNRVYLSSNHISRQTVHDIHQYLDESSFRFFTGYPSAMYVLASLMDEFDLELSACPEWIVTGSDALLPKYESVISKAFGAPVTEQYGMAEFAGNMSKCEHGNFHVDFECCHVESKLMRNTNGSALVLTGWGNRAMPFIRYEVGDSGEVMLENCSCGRESDVFRSIDGRLEDYIVTPNGRKLIGMNQVFEYAENAREIQIYQKRHSQVEFRIVPAPGFGSSDKDALTREFRRRGGEGMAIHFTLVKELERSPSGKFKAVISEI